MRRACLTALAWLAVTSAAPPASAHHDVGDLAKKRATSHRLMVEARAERRYEAFRHWRERFRHWRNEHVWARRYAALPRSMKAALARLRGCETRGIPYPRNYRWRGRHRGAYQYRFDTWRRAGGRGDPADATPHEQDVRTAWFWPSHRGEWACKA